MCGILLIVLVQPIKNGVSILSESIFSYYLICTTWREEDSRYFYDIDT